MQIFFELQVLLGALCLCVAAWAVKALRSSKSQQRLLERTGAKAGNSSEKVQRRTGEWKAVEFDFPKFSSCEVPLEARKPPPYRPFRWGKYNITMGIRSMPWSEWIEVDNELPKYHIIRTDRVANRGEKAVCTLPEKNGVPGGSLAAKELCFELAEYLSRRYPDTYQVKRYAPQPDDFGWYGEGQIKEITIIPVGATYDLDTEDPMKVSGLLIEDDLALMLEGGSIQSVRLFTEIMKNLGPDGRYYFQAGAIIVPGFWRMEDKLGLPLEEIHTRGAVPQYREKLQNSMGRFLFKLAVDKPVIRNNYFFQIVRPEDDSARIASIDPDELAWSDSTNGHEDFFEQLTKEPTLKAQQSGQVQFKAPTPTDSVERIRLRTERQTLRRLPRSGAIAFTIRTYIFPITDLAKEPSVPGRMASAVRSWPEDVQQYKGGKLYSDVLLPYLDDKHAEQVRQGVADEEGGQNSNYPY